MKWLKHVVLDIIVLALIAIYTIYNFNIINIILWVYSTLLLVSKLLYLFVDFFKIKAINNVVPNLFYHIVYLLSIILFIISANYYLSIIWIIIWLVSILSITKKQIKKV